MEYQEHTHMEPIAEVGPSIPSGHFIDETPDLAEELEAGGGLHLSPRPSSSRRRGPHRGASRGLYHLDGQGRQAWRSLRQAKKRGAARVHLCLPRVYARPGRGDSRRRGGELGGGGLCGPHEEGAHFFRFLLGDVSPRAISRGFLEMALALSQHSSTGVVEAQELSLYELLVLLSLLAKERRHHGENP